MICDRCIKKSVCKLCDGSSISGCIEFMKEQEPCDDCISRRAALKVLILNKRGMVT